MTNTQYLAYVQKLKAQIRPEDLARARHGLGRKQHRKMAASAGKAIAAAGAFSIGTFLVVSAFRGGEPKAP